MQSHTAGLHVLYAFQCKTLLQWRHGRHPASSLVLDLLKGSARSMQKLQHLYAVTAGMDDCFNILLDEIDQVWWSASIRGWQAFLKNWAGWPHISWRCPMNGCTMVATVTHHCSKREWPHYYCFAIYEMYDDHHPFLDVLPKLWISTMNAIPEKIIFLERNYDLGVPTQLQTPKLSLIMLVHWGSLSSLPTVIQQYLALWLHIINAYCTN